MPKKRNPAFSKKVKKRAPIRQAFHDEFVKNNDKIISVRFTHYKNQDYLYVLVDKSFWGRLPTEYMGYPVFIKTAKESKADENDAL